MIGVNNGNGRTRSQCDGAGQPPIEVDKSKLSIRTRRRGGHPFQQLPLPIQPRQRPNDGIDHQPGLVRKQRHLEAELHQGDSEIQTKCAEVTAGRDPRAMRHHASDER